MRSTLSSLVLACALASGCEDDTNDAANPGDGQAADGADGESGDASPAGDGKDGASDGNADGTADAATPDGGEDGGSSGTTQPVTIRFAARLGDQPLQCGQTYSSFGTSAVDVELLDLRMYVQDVALIRADGTEVPVALDVRAPWQNDSVAMIDLEDATGGCGGQGSAGMNAEITGSVEAGEYVGLTFRNGVPETLNHQNPIENAAPLNDVPLHWGWLFGYIFFKAELGQVTETGGGSSLCHVGSTACDGSPGSGFTCTKLNRNRVVLSSFDLATDEVVVDLAPLFQNDDLSAVTACHSEQEACETYFPRLGVDFATGAAAEEGQVVFRAAPVAAP